MSITKPKVLTDLLVKNAEKYPEKETLQIIEKGVYKGTTYSQLLKNVVCLSSALKKLGFENGDRLAIFSDNCPEWVLMDMAGLLLGVITVPIYATLGTQEMEYILKDSGAKGLFVLTSSQLTSYHEVKNNCPQCEFLFVKSQSQDGYNIDELIASYETTIEFPNRAYQQLLSAQPNDIASIVYTSGTTGLPKGVMLTHHNFLANVQDSIKAIPELDDTVSVLSFLPLAHVFERMAGYYTIFAIGGTIFYAQNVDTVRDNLLLAKPTVLVSVPRIYEKIYAAIMAQLTPLKKIIFKWALWVGKQRFKKQKIGPLLRLQHKLLDKMVYKKLRDKFGGNIRFCISGGAPLAKSLCEFFLYLGLPVIEGYGMTEASPVIACNRLSNIQTGTVGKALDHVETKLGEDGELLVRGPNIMKGYWHLQDKTAEVLDEDGWLATGDIAHIDETGSIHIVDRKKELIVLSNGKKVSPQKLELTLSKSSLIDQVFVIGDNRNFVTALIYSPNHQEAAVNEQVQAELDRLQKTFSNYEKIKKFHLLNAELTQKDGFITPSLKPKRKVILERFKDEIEALYS